MLRADAIDAVIFLIAARRYFLRHFRYAYYAMLLLPPAFRYHAYVADALLLSLLMPCHFACRRLRHFLMLHYALIFHYAPSFSLRRCRLLRRR